jgi:hypothetical protein
MLVQLEEVIANHTDVFEVEPVKELKAEKKAENCNKSQNQHDFFILKLLKA